MLRLAALFCFIFSANITAQASVEIPVDFVVLQDSAGSGNSPWADPDGTFIPRVLQSINTRFFVTERAEFVMGELQVLQNSDLYHSPQRRLMRRYRQHRQRGRILVVISREERIDSHGLAEKQGVTYRPVIIMRGAYQDTANPMTQIPDYLESDLHVTQAAGLFRHELGHQINFRHIVDNPALNTDNFTSVPEARERWESYLERLAREGR